MVESKQRTERLRLAYKKYLKNFSANQSLFLAVSVKKMELPPHISVQVKMINAVTE